MWDFITSPSLIIDEKRVKNNILTMANKAKDLGLKFRPHFKTHQSATIGEWFRDAGVDRIAVASLHMAEYFAHHNWDDILLAFPVNLREIKHINILAAKINLGLVVESVETCDFLRKNLSHPVDIWIKIDTGYQRTGIAASETLVIEEILQVTEHSTKLIFKGILSHSGNTYNTQHAQQVEAIHANSMLLLRNIKEQWAVAYPNLKISIGDTPSCSICSDFKGADEFRPGVFVFYDWMQHQLQACTAKQLALAIALPIVAKHKIRNEIVVQGGAVHLSKDSILDQSGQAFFGCAVSSESWEPLPEIYLKKLSQEHGIIHVPDSHWYNYQVGDLIFIMPIHACLTANLHHFFFTTTGQRIEKMHGSTANW